MGSTFDPYHKWLGISPREQPAHHYRLLGLPLFESDVEVISSAADQRMAHVRTFQSGKHSALSQLLLNELAAAKLVLLDPTKKLAYDKALRAKLASRKSPEKPKPRTRGQSAKSRSEPQKKNPPAVAEAFDFTPTNKKTGTPPPSRKRNSLRVPLVLLGAGGVLTALLSMVLLGSGGRDSGSGELVEKEKPPQRLKETASTKFSSPSSFSKTPGTTTMPPKGNDEKSPMSTADIENHRPPPPLEKTINLIGLIDPVRDAIHGTWKIENGVVLTPALEHARLQIPFEPPAEYQIDIVAVRKEGDDCLTMGLVSGESQVAATLDGWRGEYSGLDKIDGQRPDIRAPKQSARLFELGERRAISFQVRPTGIRVLVDDEPAISWEGNSERFSLYDRWKVPDTKQLFLGSHVTSYEIHKLTIGPLRAEGSLPETTATTEPLVYLDDLQEAGFAVGFGTLGKHGATAYPTRPEEPRECRYQDMVPAHALSAHPRPHGSSFVTYHIDGKYETFRTTGALMQANRRPISSTPLSFKIFGDGLLLWESRPIEQMGDGEDCQVSVAGVHVLRLQVDCPGPSMMRRAVWINPVLEATATESEGEEEAEMRLAIPESVARDAATAEVQKLFATEIKEATTAEKKLALAERFLELAQETTEDAAAQFVLFQQGWTQAVDAGAAETALTAVVDLAGRYQVDALKMKIATLERLADNTLGKEKNAALAASILPIIEETLVLENYEAAAEIGNLAVKAARKASDIELVKQIAAKNKFTAEIARAAREAEEAETTLQSNANDPEANLIVGRFLCFLKDDWAAGLPHLVLSGEDALQKAAKAELDKPSDPLDHLRLGDMWWDVTKSETGVIRERQQQRAAFWYQMALPNLEDRLSKAKVEKRLSEVDDSYTRSTSESRPVEKWISRDATYIASSQFGTQKPLASLLTEDEFLHMGEFAFHTKREDPFSSIVIDLQSEEVITRLLIENRRKVELYGRAKGLTLWLSSTAGERGEQVWTAPSIASGWEVRLEKPTRARYVTLGLPPGGMEPLHLAKVKVFGFSKDGIAVNAMGGGGGELHPFLGYKLGKHPDGAIPFGGHWYALILEARTWSSAQERCKQMGGYLICVEYPAEAQLVRQLAGGRFLWLGGIRLNNRWGWINGSPMVYSNWGGGEPNNSGGKENRLEAKYSSRWNDCSGGARRIFICEWEF